MDDDERKLKALDSPFGRIRALRAIATELGFGDDLPPDMSEENLKILLENEAKLRGVLSEGGDLFKEFLTPPKREI